ncbi:MAG TPA: DinB family protein [bacterium]|nr:DinB family protein [bacterium]
MTDLLNQFRKNFQYNHWANDLFRTALLEMKDPPEKGLQLFRHILFAMDVWLARLQTRDLSGFKDPYPPIPLAEFGAKLEGLRAPWDSYLSQLEPGDLEKTFVFANVAGERYEQVVRNVLVHVVNHSHYHRGQLASVVHQAGGRRPNTDYNAYMVVTGEAKKLG